MPQTTNIRKLVINKLTQEQYDAATKNADELYLTPDTDSLPSQTGQSGKYLKTNGTTTSWESVPAGTVTSVRVQATSPVVSSQNTAQTATLNTNISLADGYGDTKNPYGTKTAKYVLAGPVSGSATAPTFRALVKSDIPLDSETAESGGTITSLVTTGEKYTWNSKQDALSTQTAYTSKGSATKVPQITTNTLGQVTGITEVDITHQSIKSIKSDNTTAQSTNSSEAVAGSGTINLHKIAKTGTFSDLLSKPTSISGYGITDAYTKTEVDGMISSVYKPAGSVAFASLPTLASGVLGNVYNVTDAFTTTTDFVEGSGKSYPAGTNVVVVEPTSGTYKFDVLAGFVDLSGYVPTSRTVNGKALSANISLTASDVGAISSHQSIKTLKTDNTTAQSTSSSEAIAGSGTINLHKVSKTGSYDDLLNKPTIPTVNDSTITIQKNSTTVDTFTLNQSTNKSINISVPTTVAELSDASDYIQTSDLEEIDINKIVPTQTGNNGKVLTTNGTAVSWGTIDTLPSQSGQSGKFLTTNGTNASWGEVSSIWTYDSTNKTLEIS